MNTNIPTPKPHGLFRYLYNHYLVRYPDLHISVHSVSSDETLDAVEKIDADNLELYLEGYSWLIAVTRPNLDTIVSGMWGRMSPLARGNYLAGFIELTYLGRGQDGARVSYITEQLGNKASIAFTADTACQIGCALIGLGMIEAFQKSLQFDIDWEQEIERNSPTNFRRWKSIDRLSKRVIDVFLEASLILKRPDATRIALDHRADPNIPVWQLERSSNALYPALSYAITNELTEAVDALLEAGANPRGLEYTELRIPLAVAFLKNDFPLVRRLLAAGASLEDGSREKEVPMTYGIGSPVEWVKENLSDLLGLLPFEAKALFHYPHAQGGHYYTLLECVWGNPDRKSVV
jgi:hypothetical protein